jgi:hypothetical protein
MIGLSTRSKNGCGLKLSCFTTKSGICANAHTHFTLNNSHNDQSNITAQLICAVTETQPIDTVETTSPVSGSTISIFPVVLHTEI